ncbi:hypothetical protein LEMLEM_LOCUS8941 [Lemmus lemmus]
MNTKRNR